MPLPGRPFRMPTNGETRPVVEAPPGDVADLAALRQRHRRLADLTIRLGAEMAILETQHDEAVRRVEALVGTSDLDEIDRIIAKREAESAAALAEFEQKISQIEQEIARLGDAEG